MPELPKLPEPIFRTVYSPPDMTPRQVARQMLNAVDPLSAAVAKLQADLYWQSHFYSQAATLHNPQVCNCWLTGNHKPVRLYEDRHP
jgi:hypothetical protein